MRLSLGIGVLLAGGGGAAGAPVNPNNFTFTLDDTYVTSASVYDASGNQIRTIWDSKTYAAGTHVETWDLLDDYGDPITGTYGVDYVVAIGRNQCSVSWYGGVGNTSPHAYGPEKMKLFTQMTDSVVANDKVVFVTGYAEGVPSSIVAYTYSRQSILEYPLNSANYNIFAEEQYVATDGDMIICAAFDAYGTDSFVYGYYAKDLTQYPFSYGTTEVITFGYTYNYAFSIDTGGSSDAITGLAINDDYIFVCRGGIDEIQIIEKYTGTTVTNTSYTNPRNIKCQGTDVWFIHGTGTVQKFTTSGTTLTPDLTLSGLVDPISISLTRGVKYYVQNVNSDISGKKAAQTYIPSGSAGSVSATPTSTSLLLQVATDLGVPYLNNIPASTWTFYTNYQLSGGLYRFVYEVYKITSGGTETLLFSVNSAGLSTIVPSTISTSYSASAITIAEDERIVVKYYGQKTGGLGTGLLAIYFDGTNETNISFDIDTKYVYVTDGGTSQQIKIYDSSDGSSVTTIGTAGGYDNGPAVSNSKLYFDDGVTELNSARRRTFLVPLLDETMWVMDSGMERMQHFDSSGTWIEGTMCLPHSYSVFINPNEPTIVTNEYIQFYVPLDSPEDWVPTYNWRWRVTADFYLDFKGEILKGITTFPDNEMYAMLFDQRAYPTGKHYEWVWLDTTYGLVFTGSITNKFENIQVLHNGNIRRYTDGSGIGDTMYFQEAAISSLSGNVPVWGSFSTYAQCPTTAVDDPAYNNNRSTLANFDSGKSVLYNNGITNEGYHMGFVKDGESVYSNRLMPATIKGTNINDYYSGYSGPYPEDLVFDIGNQVIYPGALFLAYGNFGIAQYHGENWKQGQVNKFHLMYENGMQLLIGGICGFEAEALYGESGYMMAGNVQAGGVYATSTKMYYFCNDEFFQSAICMFTISGLDTFTVSNAIEGGTYVPEAGVDLLADLPTRSDISTTGNITVSNTTYYNTGDDYWILKSGMKSYNVVASRNNDMFVMFKKVSGSEYVDLSFTGTVTTFFKVWGKIMFDGSEANFESATNGIYVRVLDGSDKVIAQISYNQLNLSPGPYPLQIQGNNVSIFEQTTAMSYYVRNWQDFEIYVDASGCDFSYAGNTISNQPIVDGTADWTNPVKIDVYCVGYTVNRSRVVDTMKLRYDYA